MSLARRHEIEAQGLVRAESAFVGEPIEAAGRFGGAGGLEIVHAWVVDAMLVRDINFMWGLEEGGTYCS